MTQPPPDQQPTQHAPRGPQGPPQPPYGAGGHGAPYQPAQPYQQPYQQPYAQPLPASSGAGKTIAIVVGVIVVLALMLCGGVVAFIFWVANEVEDSVDDWDPDRVGGRNDPITVEPGAAFEIDGIEYAEGWRIQPPTEEYRGDTIVGLTGTNERDDESSKSAYLYFTFVDADDVEVGEISCSSDGSIAAGNSEALDCDDFEKIDGPYDHIEVSAS